MKISTLKGALLGACVLTGLGVFAQGIQPDLQNYRLPGYDGLNVFETKKDTETPFDGLKVRVGGDFALQFQGINHTNAAGVDTLINLGSNFNLPTANLNLDVQLADGMRMHLRTYLSSRHHTEAYVKGGYLQVDKLDFIKEGFLSGVMDITTLKIGLDEINYGDAHFRRSDNAAAIYNPFVGNYIMDSFTTEAFGEVVVQPNDWLIVFGVSNGNLNQSVAIGDKQNKASIYGKIGWDSQVNDDLRVRITGSFLTSPGYDNGTYLYAGDRAGARYYHVMEAQGEGDDFRSGRFNPAFRKFNTFQVNPFVKWKGLEFFGIFEMSMGNKSDNEATDANGKKLAQGGQYTQIGAEALYRFGGSEQFYVGGRFNSVGGYGSEAESGVADISISRINAGLGWFLTNNVLTKLEYVSQSYSGDGYVGTKFQDGNFNGVMFEAVIGF